MPLVSIVFLSSSSPLIFACFCFSYVLSYAIAKVTISLGKFLFALYYAFLVVVVALLRRVFAFHWEIFICIFWTFIYVLGYQAFQYQSINYYFYSEHATFRFKLG